MTCQSGHICSGGSCVVSCQAGLTNCNGVCVDTQVNPGNCGGCANVPSAGNHICSPSQFCNAGACTTTCTPSVLFFESFVNNSQGWSLGTQWQVGAAAASSCAYFATGNDPATDHTATADNGVAGILIGGCYGTALHGAYCLTSPALDLSGVVGDLYLSYYRHLHTDYPNYISSYAQVYDGSSWVTVYSVPNSVFVNDSSWVYQQYNVTAHKNATFQIRFCYSAGPSTGIFNGGGWSVDDVAIFGCN